MNAVEIEEEVSALAERPFDAEEFPFAFLQAFGNKFREQITAAEHIVILLRFSSENRPVLPVGLLLTQAPNT